MTREGTEREETGGDGIRHDRTEDKIKVDGVGWGRIGQDVQTSRERPCFPKWEANEIMKPILHPFLPPFRSCRI